VPHTAERQELVPFGRGPQLPTRPVHPGRPAAAVDASRRGGGSPIDPEGAEYRAPPLSRRNHPIERAIDRSRHAQPIERNFGGPSATQREAATGGSPRQREHSPRPGGPEDEPSAGPSRGRTQQRDGQCVIIAAQRFPGNGKTGGRDLKPKLRNEFQRAVPRTPVGGGVATEATQIARDARADAVGQQWEQRRPHPRAQVPRVGVGGIFVGAEAAGRDVARELAMREREERAHQAVASAARDPREARGGAAAQRAQHYRLDLIVLMVRGDEIRRAQAVLDFAQPRVPRTPRDGLGGLGSEVELDGFEWQSVLLGEFSDRPADRPPGRLNSVVHVRHNERQAELGRNAVQQVEEGYGISAPRDGGERRSGCAEQARARQVSAEAFGERRSPCHVSLSMLPPDQTYQLLRNLTSPVVAVTSERDGKENGMISDAAIRASIVPTVPRLSVYVHKFNFSHDLIFDTGRFVLHLLHTKQFDLIHRLGFVSGRDRDKLADVPHRPGVLGAPVLDDCWAHFECRVANVMDTGNSTLFLGDVVDVGFGAGKQAQGDVMTAAYFRANMPAEWRKEYQAGLEMAQRFAEERSRDLKPLVWRGLRP